MMLFWTLAPSDSSVHANVSKKHTVSIFKAEALTVCFSETLASTDESTRRQNPEERHHFVALFAID
jgi:hypothetical protein